jgi:hypothetical protein
MRHTMEAQVTLERVLNFHGNSRARYHPRLAGLNRRMRKTARTVVWEN